MVPRNSSSDMYGMPCVLHVKPFVPPVDIQTILKRRVGLAGAVARQSKERLPSRVSFGTMARGKNPRSGGRFKTRHRFRVEDLAEFRATKGSTEHSSLMFRPPCGPLQKNSRGSGTGGSLKNLNGSW